MVVTVERFYCEKSNIYCIKISILKGFFKNLQLSKISYLLSIFLSNFQELKFKKPCWKVFFLSEYHIRRAMPSSKVKQLPKILAGLDQNYGIFI